jgi:hypothetical protein
LVTFVGSTEKTTSTHETIPFAIDPLVFYPADYEPEWL